MSESAVIGRAGDGDAGVKGIYSFLPQDRVLFGAGSLTGLADEVERLGGRRVLIVTGRSLATRTSVVRAVEGALGTLHAGTTDAIREHAPRGGVDEAVQVARSCGADLLVSVGGGSPIDAAKAVTLALAGESSTVLPHIAVPTTLSAAEFSHLAGVSDEAGTHLTKTGYADVRLTPRVALLDAELTLETPERLWLSSGIRALDHAVESLYAPGAHPVSDVLALEAVRLLFAYLPVSQARPRDLAARTQLQLAAWMSFFGELNTPMGLSHNLGRAMGASYGVAHGITSCLTLAPVMRLAANDPARAAALRRIPSMVGLDPAGPDDRSAALAAADAVDGLVARLGLPRRLREVGVGMEAVPDLAARTATDPRQRAAVEALLHSIL